LYPRSLLYLVSGMFEYAGSDIAVDLPILGMQRYFDDAKTYGDEAIAGARIRFGHGTAKSHVVWSASDGGSGRIADSVKHGTFDDAGYKTMASVIHILKQGL
jgi:hypothetical protein